jgi:sec-independent protein translocase protein TatC
MSEEKEINNTETQENEQLNFFDHLEELRKRILWGIVGLIIGCIISGIFIEQIMNYVLLLPAKTANLKLQNLRPFGIPFLYFKLIFIIGFIISFPFILYQLWLFIEPALYRNEKAWAKKITFFTSLCFLTGVAFAFFLMIPSMLGFAASFGNVEIQNNIDINEYFGFITMTMLAAGIIFEMPMLSYVLTKFGVITPNIILKYWRHSIVIIFILAAILTPTPDPINQTFFAVPLILLYFISYWISKLSFKPKID